MMTKQHKMRYTIWAMGIAGHVNVTHGIYAQPNLFNLYGEDSQANLWNLDPLANSHKEQLEARLDNAGLGAPTPFRRTPY